MQSLSCRNLKGAGSRPHQSYRRNAACRAQATAVPELLKIDSDFAARHTFNATANWVVPGYIMIGEYPFVNGSTCKKHAEGEQRLQQILGAGITAFASTLKELPSQQDMPIGGTDGFIPYKPTADLIAAGLSGPPPSEIVEGLRNPYLDQYVPPRKREASQAYQAYSPIRPKYFKVPIDFSVPAASADDLAESIDALKATLEEGDKLYLHCSGGTGRSAVVAACLLVRLYGVSPDDACARIQKARNLRGDSPGETIESPAQGKQVQYVRDFCKRYA